MNAISGCKTYCFTPDLIGTLYHFKVTKGAISKRKSVSDQKKKSVTKGVLVSLKNLIWRNAIGETQKTSQVSTIVTLVRLGPIVKMTRCTKWRKLLLLISSSLVFLHQRRTRDKQQILRVEISHIIFSLFQLFSVFNKNFLGSLQSPVTKNDHSKSSFDGFHCHKMISHSRPISRKLKNSFKSFKVWWEQLLMENRTMNWVFDLGFINCDLNVKRKAN